MKNFIKLNSIMVGIAAMLFTLMVVASCNTKRNEKSQSKTSTHQLIKEKTLTKISFFPCAKGEMKSAWYESGQDESSPNIAGLKSDFTIVVDTTLKAVNFISGTERHYRNLSTKPDTTSYSFSKELEKLTKKQKLKKVDSLIAFYKTKADSIHHANNTNKHQVWIINNSADTVTFQMQEGSFICVLQALTKEGLWYPIQFWRFTGCGNSNYDQHLLPKTANSFVTTLPKHGDYKTKLRYKFLGKDKFYYSNGFDGNINYCEFVEDSSTCNCRYGSLKLDNKLDVHIDLNPAPINLKPKSN